MSVDDNKDWFTLSQALGESPSACRYSPQHNYLKPQTSGYAGYREDSILADGKSPSNNRDSWLGNSLSYYKTEQFSHQNNKP